MVRFKMQIAGHRGAMGKICNDEAAQSSANLGRRVAVHDSIRASLTQRQQAAGDRTPS